MMQLSTPDLVVFLKKLNPSSLVESTILVIFVFLMAATVLSGVRATLDDSAWPVVVCVFNVISLIIIIADAWFFSFKSFSSLLVMLLFDSVSTVGNIVMCFLGGFYMRALSSIILIFWFASKGVLIAIVLSTTMKILVTYQDIIEDSGTIEEDQ